MGVNFTRNFTESYSEIVESLQNKTLVVTTIYVRSKSGVFCKARSHIFAHYILQSPPYSMYRDSQKMLKGNDVFEGYAIDLIKEVAEILSNRYNQPTFIQEDKSMNQKGSKFMRQKNGLKRGLELVLIRS